MIFLKVPSAPTTTRLSTALPDCNPVTFNTLVASVHIVVGFVSAPPNSTKLPVFVRPLLNVSALNSVDAEILFKAPELGSTTTKLSVAAAPDPSPVTLTDPAVEAKIRSKALAEIVVASVSAPPNFTVCPAFVRPLVALLR